MDRKWPLVVLFAGALWTSGRAMAQPVAVDTRAPTMDLAGVLEVAVRQSPTLELARIDQSIARARVLEATGIEDILLVATGNGQLVRNKAVAGNVIGTNEQNRLEGEVTASKLLSTGGTLSLSAGTSRNKRVLAATGMSILDYTSNITAQLSQPLLRGRGEAVTRAAQRQAVSAAEAARLQLEADTRDEIRRIVSAYWELVYAHRDLEIRESALEVAIERRRLTQSSITLGSAPRTALLEVDQVIATREEDILLARQRVTERSLELRRMAGLPVSATELDLMPTDKLNAQLRDFELVTVIEQALAASPELAILDQQREGAEIEVEVGENGLLSRLDLTLSGGPLGTDQTFGSALRGTLEARGYAVGGGLRLEHSLGRHSAEGSLRRSRESVHQIRVNRADMDRQLAAAAAQAVRAAETARKRMELSQRAIDLSAENIEAERRRFELGKATNFDVLQRQEEQKEARLRFARATVDYLQAALTIDSLSGALLQHYGISVHER